MHLITFGHHKSAADKVRKKVGMPICRIIANKPDKIEWAQLRPEIRGSILYGFESVVSVKHCLNIDCVFNESSIYLLVLKCIFCFVCTCMLFLTCLVLLNFRMEACCFSLFLRILYDRLNIL